MCRIAPVAKRLQELLGRDVPLLSDLEAVVLQPGAVALLENVRFLEGEKAGVEALYTASDHMVKVKFPHLPMPIFIDADELRGDRRIYETHLEAIIGQLDGPGWEATGLRVVDSADWPVWALTMVNRSLGQRVIIVVDRRQWLPTRIERFDATSSEAYEVWTFEDYRVDPPSITKASDKDHLASKG